MIYNGQDKADTQKKESKAIPARHMNPKKPDGSERATQTSGCWEFKNLEVTLGTEGKGGCLT